MTVEASITINATKAAVWAATTDIPNLAHFLSGVEKIELVSRPASGLVGLKWKETRILFGKPATVQKWITEAKENESYTTRAEQDGFVFITTNRVSGSDGNVLLTGIHETQPQGFAAKLKSLPMIFFKGVIKKAILRDLNDIKAGVESTPEQYHLLKTMEMRLDGSWTEPILHEDPTSFIGKQLVVAIRYPMGNIEALSHFYGPITRITEEDGIVIRRFDTGGAFAIPPRAFLVEEHQRATQPSSMAMTIHPDYSTLIDLDSEPREYGWNPKFDKHNRE